MNVAITRLPTGGTFDISDRLSDIAPIILTQESERAAFERVVDDIHIRMSNIDGLATTIFKNPNPDTKWEVTVGDDDGELLFTGRVKTNLIRFDVRDEWCDFDAFSLTRQMWNILKGSRIRTEPAFPGLGDPYWKLSDFFPHYFVTNGLLGDLIQGFNLTEYVGREIRSSARSPDPSFLVPVGNEGMFSNLDTNLRWKDLLEEMAIYYNCEFFIDKATRRFSMVKRNTPNSQIATNIDAKLVEDAGIDVTLVDESFFEYIYAFTQVEINRPIFVREQAVPVGLPPGSHQYRMTVQIGEPERFASETLFTVVPLREFGIDGRITLRIPASGLSTTSSRHLYRYSPSFVGNPTENEFRFIATFVGNGSIEFIDDGVRPPGGPLTVNPLNFAPAWYRFNSSTNDWDDPIIDYGTDATLEPVGEIFDAIPKLRFHEYLDPDTLRNFNLFEVASFFARDLDVNTFQNQFKDMFLLKTRAQAKYINIDYQLNDLVESARLSKSVALASRTGYIIKRAAANLTKDETVLELLEYGGLIRET